MFYFTSVPPCSAPVVHRDHLLSAHTKFFEKLTFLTPWYAYQGVRNFWENFVYILNGQSQKKRKHWDEAEHSLEMVSFDVNVWTWVSFHIKCWNFGYCHDLLLFIFVCTNTLHDFVIDLSFVFHEFICHWYFLRISWLYLSLIFFLYFMNLFVIDISYVFHEFICHEIHCHSTWHSYINLAFKNSLDTPS